MRAERTALACLFCGGDVRQLPSDGSYICGGCGLPLQDSDTIEVAPAGNGHKPLSSSSSILEVRPDDDHRPMLPVRAADFVDEEEEVDEEWLLEGRIPAGGITLLVSLPKVGKSRFARQLCRDMEKGADLCGKRVAKGRALYLALEELPRDLKRHLRGLGAQETLMWAKPFRLTQENLSRLTLWIRQYEINLVVIDTLNRAWMVEKGADRRQADMAMSPLIDIAHTMDCAILILHHLRKAPGEDGSDVAESNDIVAAADQVIYLKRDKQHVNRRILQAPSIGRYAPQPDLALEFNDEGIFDGLGEAEAVQSDEERDVILGVITSDWYTRKELAEDTGLSEASVRRRMQELEADGLIKKQGRGVKYDPTRYKALSSSDHISKSDGDDDHPPSDTEPQSEQSRMDIAMPAANVDGLVTL